LITTNGGSSVSAIKLLMMVSRCRLAAWIVITGLMFARVAPVQAHSGDVESHTLSLLKFATGMITAYALHETGHAVAGCLTDTDLEWGLGTYNQPLGFTEKAKRDSDGMIVHAAGLTAQVVTSEVILQSEAIDKNDSFVRGLIVWNIINPIIYSLDYWLFEKTNQENGSYYQGDLKGFEHYSDERTANGFAALMVGLAIYQGYRFVKTQNWAPDWIGGRSIQLSFQPCGRSGAALLIQKSF